MAGSTTQTELEALTAVCLIGARPDYQLAHST